MGNHDNASELLKKAEKDNRRFREFLADNIAKPENKNLSMASYLIMPIQRIPRYKLLIEELLRNTLDSHPDHPHLLKGLDLVSSVARHINAEMHASENRSAIVRIQNEFTHAVNFVQPSRKFVRQGTLVKKCRSSDKVSKHNNITHSIASQRMSIVCSFLVVCCSLLLFTDLRVLFVQRHVGLCVQECVVFFRCALQVAPGDPYDRGLQHRGRSVASEHRDQWRAVPLPDQQQNQVIHRVRTGPAHEDQLAPGVRQDHP